MSQPPSDDPDSMDAELNSFMGFNSFTANTTPKRGRGRGGRSRSSTPSAPNTAANGNVGVATVGQAKKKRKTKHKGFQPDKVGTGANASAIGVRVNKADAGREGKSEAHEVTIAGAQLDGTALSRIKPGVEETRGGATREGKKDVKDEARGAGRLATQKGPGKKSVEAEDAGVSTNGEANGATTDGKWSKEDARGILNLASPRKTLKLPTPLATNESQHSISHEQDMEYTSPGYLPSDNDTEDAETDTNAQTFNSLNLKDKTGVEPHTGLGHGLANITAILRQPSNKDDNADTPTPATDRPDISLDPAAQDFQPSVPTSSSSKDKGKEVDLGDEASDHEQGPPELIRQELGKYSNGVQGVDGTTTFFRPGFLEDPWMGLEMKMIALG